MHRRLRQLLVSTVVLGAVLLFAPTAAQAEDVSSLFKAQGISVSADLGSGAPDEVLAWRNNDNSISIKYNAVAALPVGGLTTTDPDIYSYNNIQYLFARGTDGAVWWRTFTAGVASAPAIGWASLGGFTTSGPSAAVSLDGTTIYLFARGTDGAAWWRVGSTTTGVFGPWAFFGGGLASDPDVSANQYRKGFTVTATGTNQQVYVHGFNGVYFTGWYGLGGFATSGSSITFDGRALHVIARGPDNAAYFRDTAGGGVWTNWTYLGGTLVSDPDIFALDVDWWWGSSTGSQWYKQAWAKGGNGAFFNNTWGANDGTTGTDNWGGWQTRFTPS